MAISNRDSSFNGFPNFVIPKFDYLLRYFKCDQFNVFKNICPSFIYDELQPEPPIYVCKFIDAPGLEHQIVFANEDGVIAFQDTITDVNYNGLGFQAHQNAIFDLSWVKSTDKFISASGDRSAVLWQMNSFNKLTHISTFKGHNGSVKTIDLVPDNDAIFASGGRDNTIIIWDTRTGSKENVIKKAHRLQNSSEGLDNRAFDKNFRVTSVKFLDSHTLFSSADGDGFINVWDLRRSHTLSQEPHQKFRLCYGGTSSKRGYSCLLMPPCKSRLYASCMDSHIYEYNILGYNQYPIRSMVGHQNYTYFIRTALSPDGHYLLSGSSDSNAYIWNVKSPENNPLVSLKGHKEEVNALAWCPVDITKIVTCSDDFTHRIWSIDRSSSPSDINNQGDNGIAEVISQVPPNLPKTFARAQIDECGSCCDVNYVTPKARKRPLTSPASHTCKVSLKFSDGPSTPATPSSMCKSLKRTYTMLDWIQSPSPPKQPNPLKRKYEVVDENNGCLSASPLRSNSSPLSPIKFINKDNLPDTPESLSPCSPRKRVSKAVNRSLLFSPTSNLPDFVQTGDSPHLPSRPKTKRKCTNWLTNLSLSKTLPIKKRKLVNR